MIHLPSYKSVLRSEYLVNVVLAFMVMNTTTLVLRGLIGFHARAVVGGTTVYVLGSVRTT